MTAESVFAGEVRAEGKRIVGVALHYNRLAGDRPEKFLPGSFGKLDDGATRFLDLAHSKLQVAAYAPGGGLELIDGPDALRIEAQPPDIPPGRAALAAVRQRILTGLSVDFHALAEHRENGVRVISKARLNGVSLVRAPAYTGSTAEVRRRSGVTLRQRIPAGKKLGCRCSGASCRFARIMEPAMQQAFDDGFKEAAEVLAVRSNYGTPLASKSMGSVRARILAGGDGEVEIDLPDGPDGEAVLRDIENTGAVLIRPHFDSQRSKGTEQRAEGELTMVYERAVVRSLIVGATDAVEGWPKLEVDRGDRSALELPDPVSIEQPAAPAKARRVWL